MKFIAQLRSLNTVIPFLLTNIFEILHVTKFNPFDVSKWDITQFNVEGKYRNIHPHILKSKKRKKSKIFDLFLIKSFFSLTFFRRSLIFSDNRIWFFLASLISFISWSFVLENFNHHSFISSNVVVWMPKSSVGTCCGIVSNHSSLFIFYFFFIFAFLRFFNWEQYFTRLNFYSDH